MILVTLFPKWITFLQLKLSNIPLIFYQICIFSSLLEGKFASGFPWQLADRAPKLENYLKYMCIGGREEVWINHVCIYKGIFFLSCKHSFLPIFLCFGYLECLSLLVKLHYFNPSKIRGRMTSFWLLSKLWCCCWVE